MNIKKAFNEWWEKHQLGSSSMNKENALYAFKYGYKAKVEEIELLKETLKWYRDNTDNPYMAIKALKRLTKFTKDNES